MILHERVQEASRLANIELRNKEDGRAMVSQKELQDDGEAVGDEELVNKLGKRKKKPQG